MTVKAVLVNYYTGQNMDGIVSISRNGEAVLTLETIGGEFIVEDLLPSDIITVTSAGFKTGIWEAGNLDAATENILLLKPGTGTVNNSENKNLLAPALLAVAAGLLINRKKKVNGIESRDIITVAAVGAGILGFTFIRQLLEKLGIWDSRDTKDLDADATNPQSAWSPNFWRSKPANEDFTFAITWTTAESYAREIYNAFGAFNDCEECVKAVIRRMRTKANLSFLCEVFASIYGQDLLSFLRGGYWPQDRLSDADVNELNKFINNLPSY